MSEVIIVIKDGKDYKISDTALIQDYQRLKYIPELDKLLDWRLFLMQDGKYNKIEMQHIKKEILAVDYLLNLKQNK